MPIPIPMGDFIPCSVCGKPANIHLTQISTSETSKVHLCEACAAKNEVLNNSLGPLTKILSMLQKKIADEPETDNDEAEEHTCEGTCPSCATTAAKTCPRCGLTGLLFLKTRRLGCAACYKTFEEELKLILPNVQPSTIHEGKIPSGTALDGAIKELLAKAREDMAAAIKSENYEEAARLRDDIRRLESASSHEPPASLSTPASA